MTAIRWMGMDAVVTALLSSWDGTAPTMYVARPFANMPVETESSTRERNAMMATRKTAMDAQAIVGLSVLLGSVVPTAKPARRAHTA